MKNQLGVSALCDTLESSGAASAQSLPPRRHHGRVEHPGEIQQRCGMYEQGHRRGWYKKGGRMPCAYHCRRYVVRNWRAARLLPPPRGCHWVRSNNSDFLLVSVNTGIIAYIVSR